jgi:hypothetical protein
MSRPRRYSPLDAASDLPYTRAALTLASLAAVGALAGVILGAIAVNKEVTSSANKVARMSLGIESYDDVNNFRTLQDGTQFEIVVDIQVVDRMVTLSIPEIQFTSRSDYPVLDFATLSTVVANTSKFFVYTVPGSGLPLSIAPKKTLGERFRVQGSNEGDNTYSYTIRTDGSLTIADGAGNPLNVDGAHHIGAIVISYLLPSVDFSPPPNVRISTGSSNVIGSHLKGDYYDYYMNDIKRDLTTGVIRAAFVWSDNSDQGPLPRNSQNVWVRSAIVNPINGQATYGSAVRVSNARNNSQFAECAVAINPTNVNNLFTICNTKDRNFAPTAVGRFNGTGFASFDGGLTWSPGVAFPAADAIVDVSCTFDNFGNLYVQAGAGGLAIPFMEVRFSIDGGLTFSTTPVVNVSATDTANGGFIDFSKMSVGPDGSGISGRLALWFCGDEAFFSVPDIRPLVGYVPITGLGVFGSQVVIRSFTTIPRTTNGIGLSEIYVNPVTGAVYFVSKNVNDYQGPGNPLNEETISMWVNTAGTVNFTNTSFSGRRDISISNAGINTGLNAITTVLTPWAPNRGTNTGGNRPLGYDALRNRLYYIFEDVRPATFNDTYIVMVYSENEGQSWSYEYILNDKRGVVTGFPSIAVEHNTGIIAASWYDPRNDPLRQESVDLYGVVFSAPPARDGAGPSVWPPQNTKKRTPRPVSKPQVRRMSKAEHQARRR